jgi:uncharacterized repeat protein (TIGR01451 family)
MTSVNLEGSLPLQVSDDPDPVIAGTPLTYTVAVTSVGPSDATNVVLTDTLPAGVQFITLTHSSGDCHLNAGVITCQLGTMPAMTSAWLEIQVLVKTDTIGQINNQAQVTGDGLELTVANQNTMVLGSANLQVENAAMPGEATPGGIIVYTIAITNDGPSMARNVVANNSLPAGTSFRSSPVCAQSNGSITCYFGDMNPGETARTYFMVDVANDAYGPASSTVTGLSDTPDPYPANNSATATSKIIPQSDMSIGKVVTPSAVYSGDQLTYTLTITNHGPSKATGVQVIDTLPAEVTLLSTTTSQGTGCLGASVLLCSFGVLESGYTATVTIVVQIDDDFHGELTNTAEVLSGIADPDESNNRAVMTVDVARTTYYLFVPLVMND